MVGKFVSYEKRIAIFSYGFKVWGLFSDNSTPLYVAKKFIAALQFEALIYMTELCADINIRCVLWIPDITCDFHIWNDRLV